MSLTSNITEGLFSITLQNRRDAEHCVAQQSARTIVGYGWDYKVNYTSKLLFFLQTLNYRAVLRQNPQSARLIPSNGFVGHLINLCQSVTYVCMCARTRVHANMSIAQSSCTCVHTWEQDVHTLAHLISSDIS